ncbi:HAD-IA family hydrolase [Paenibacillus faecalis]|uniref:HAD-IA family hydrolase n=1 Tax=Paenibacillus faecalis TaxID=2079532 RepID=UPI000D0F3B4F|nr:HAD-IA family hydrolase [Paenibacillus faecalis]
MYKVLIFDFNGTIVQSKYLVIKLMNDLADKYGYEKIRDEDVEHLASLSIRDRLKVMKCPFYKLPMLVADVKKKYKDEVIDLDIVPGIRDVLSEVKSQGMTMGILSSNSEENIQKFLGAHNSQMFDFVYTASSIFGKEKALRKLLKERGISKDEVLYIGDELRDAEACRNLGIACVMVTWGYDAEELLTEGKPTYIIHEPEELFGIVTPM